MTFIAQQVAQSGPPEFIEWMSALSGGAAVLVALVVVHRDRRRDIRQQAAMVSAWADEVQKPRTETEIGAVVQSTPRQNTVKVHVWNASDAPVYDFIAWVRYHYGDDAPAMGSHVLHLLPPGERDVFVDWIELPKGGLAGMPYVDFTFRDEQGRRWQRLHDGGLGLDQMTAEGLSVSRRERARRRIFG